MKFLKLSLCVLFLLFSNNSSFAQGVGVPDAPAACLPSRIDVNAPRDDHRFCHCPPESMCNETVNYNGGKEYPRLPLGIRYTCCGGDTRPPGDPRGPVPNGDITLIGKHAAGCGAPYEMDPIAINICTQYALNPSYIFLTPEDEADHLNYLNDLSQCFVNEGVENIIASAISESTNKQISFNLLKNERGVTDGIDELRPLNNILFGGGINSCTPDGARFLAHAVSKNTFLDQGARELTFVQDFPSGGTALANTVLGWLRNHHDVSKYINQEITPFYADFYRFVFGSGSRSNPNFRNAYYENMDYITATTNRITNLGTQVGLNEPYAECTNWLTFTIKHVVIGTDGTCTSCLSPETDITMADGTVRQIKTIKQGNMVKTVYGTKQAKVTKVVKINWPELVLYNINQGKLKLTADHPVMTKHGWKAINFNSRGDNMGFKRYGVYHVSKLELGDIILLEDGTELEVTHMLPEAPIKDGVTYNLQLEDGASSFYANGILVKSQK